MAGGWSVLGSYFFLSAFTSYTHSAPADLLAKGASPAIYAIVWLTAYFLLVILLLSDLFTHGEIFKMCNPCSIFPLQVRPFSSLLLLCMMIN